MLVSEETYNKALVALYTGDCRLSVLTSRIGMSMATARNVVWVGELRGEIEMKGKIGAAMVFGLTGKGVAAVAAITE